MELLHQTGLSPYELLRTGTVYPAVFFEEEDKFGKVVESMCADLVLLEGNPLEDLAHVREVVGLIRSGNWLSREEIDSRLVEIARRQGE